MTTCLLNQKNCGRKDGSPVCPKCGMDERVVYPGQEDLAQALKAAHSRYDAVQQQEEAAKQRQAEQEAKAREAKALQEREVEIARLKQQQVEQEAAAKLAEEEARQRRQAEISEAQQKKDQEEAKAAQAKAARVKAASNKVWSGVVLMLAFGAIGGGWWWNAHKVPAAQSSLSPSTPSNTFIEPEMVTIPADSFQMGSKVDGSEKPIHTVSIHSFAMGKYEVTQGQWKAVMGSNPSYFKNCGDNCPVEMVSWNDTQQFIQKLNQQTGKQYRLPSEAEWEYAARAGTTTRYWWGDTASHEYANYGKDNCCGGLAQGKDRWESTAPVGQFPANAFGLHDMNGNVREWVQDVWHRTFAGAPTDGSAWTTGGDKSTGVLRGGAWDSLPGHLRSAIRVAGTLDNRGYDAGFRLAKTVP